MAKMPHQSDNIEAFNSMWQDDITKRAAWKSLVNQEVIALCGTGCDDLPDFNYVGAYNKGWSPKQTAKKVVAWSKTF